MWCKDSVDSIIKDVPEDSWIHRQVDGVVEGSEMPSQELEKQAQSHFDVDKGHKQVRLWRRHDSEATAHA